MEEKKVIENLLKMSFVGLAELQARLPEPECYLVGDVAMRVKEQLDMLRTIDVSNLNIKDNGRTENK